MYVTNNHHDSLTIGLVYPTWATYQSAKQYEKQATDYKELVQYQKLRDKVVRRSQRREQSIDLDSIDEDTDKEVQTWNQKQAVHYTFHKKWICYWIFYLIVYVFEYFCEEFTTKRFNWYYEFKLVLMIYLVVSHGCETFYENVIERVLSSENVEQEIDAKLQIVQTQAYTRFFQYLVGSKDLLLYGVAMGAEQIKKMTDKQPQTTSTSTHSHED
jgi:hypothetical protein